MNKKIWLILLAIVLIIIDQAVKRWVVSHPLFIINNPYLFFGFGPKFDLFLLSVLLVALLGYFLLCKNNRLNLGIILIISGAAANLIDRFLRGAVLDYLTIQVGFKLVFNLADLYLVAGLVVYLYADLINKKTC